MSSRSNRPFRARAESRASTKFRIGSLEGLSAEGPDKVGNPGGVAMDKGKKTEGNDEKRARARTQASDKDESQDDNKGSFGENDWDSEEGSPRGQEVCQSRLQGLV